MSEQTPATTPTPAAPQAPAAPPAPSKPTFEQAYESATRPAPPAAPAPTAAERRLMKLKIDHNEEDLDWDETWKDEAKREKARLDLQRGRNADREVERARGEAQASAKKAWNEFISEHGYDIVPAPGTKFGWKFAQRATTPAADSDPLTTEERELQAKADADEATARDLARLSSIRAERAETRALKRFQDEQSAKEQKASGDAAYEKSKGWLFGEIDTILGAHTKSFDGLDRLKARIRMDAFRAGEIAAKRGANDADTRGAAHSVIAEAVEDLTGREKKLLASLTATPPQPNSAPVIGTAPAVGGGAKPKFKDIDEAFAAVEQQLSGRR